MLKRDRERISKSSSCFPQEPLMAHVSFVPFQLLSDSSSEETKRVLLLGIPQDGMGKEQERGYI